MENQENESLVGLTPGCRQRGKQNLFDADLKKKKFQYKIPINSIRRLHGHERSKMLWDSNFGEKLDKIKGL